MPNSNPPCQSLMVPPCSLPVWRKQQNPGLHLVAGGAGRPVVSDPQCVLSAPAGQVNEQVSYRMASSGGVVQKLLVSECPVTFALSPLKSRKLETLNSKFMSCCGKTACSPKACTHHLPSTSNSSSVY